MNVTSPSASTAKPADLKAEQEPRLVRPRLAVLYSRLAPYTAASLRAFAVQYDAEMLIVRVAPANAAPFDAETFFSLGDLHDRATYDRDRLLELVEGFRPTLVFMSGWFDRDYLHVTRILRGKGVPVVAGMDTQWSGTLRQRAGLIASRFVLHSAIDVLWVPGERQRELARKLGFTTSRCRSGVYACDWAAYAQHYRPEARTGAPFFLYVGRYVEAKGLDLLVNAYHQYRAVTPAPWPLVCAGTGPLASMLQGQEGIQDHGFVQPSDLPRLMAQAAAFVLPSRHEPWGVVVQEAAAVGLPLLLSDACGAGVHLLQDGLNGYLIESGRADHLASAMVRMTRQTAATRAAMGHFSHVLSRQFTPQRWAETLMSMVRA